MSGAMEDRTEILRQFMKLANISSFQILSDRTGVSRRAIDTLRKGNAATLKYSNLAKLAEILNIEVNELIAQFIPPDLSPDPSRNPDLNLDLNLDLNPDLQDANDNADASIVTIANLRTEYQRLQQKLEHQTQELRSQFERETFYQLESLLLQLPSAAHAAQNNPNMLAKNILPLWRPLEQLLQKWGITTIGFVGAEVAYDPQNHQLMEGSDRIEEGVLAIVRYVGYRKGEKLLYRARVATITELSPRSEI
ncbi:helix-turn-helix domain-containing protein [Pseudanabaena sp. UWO310]|uniref:helix-turn-helix domain-containing protein n=1 Tax=Pseudanabaena sp. UWO310 TaxID=2480795 RepID=UPI00115ACA6F|nr:helix-turn-helix transcriptional regulator [Pseudanabaena sp. UWO310]TYQ30846.1 helix-turn-helix domain-containing protein [Pseudanabaena sp. UWO310]